MPRAIWSGSISFGLVNVPVRMYGAIDEHDLHFHYVHQKDASRIGYEKICKAEEKPVPDEEIVKAFEYEKGEYVYMTDEDFESAQVHNFKTIDIRDFVPYDDIDPIYFEKTYLLGPQENAEKVYALLREAMERSGLAAIAKYVMRDKQHLGCLRVREGVITLEKMYFADEIRPVEGVAPGDVKVDKRELEMAEQLVESFSGPFDPEKYDDTYRDALCEIIRAKRKGEETHAEKPRKPEQTPDLMGALRASLEASQRRRSAGRTAERDGGSTGKGANGGLDALSKEELYERAKELDIKGRSDMSKDELAAAVVAAS